MDDVSFFFRVMTLSLTVLFGVSILLGQRDGLSVLATSCAFAFCCYLMVPFIHTAAPGFAVVPATLATLIPSLLWLLGYWFFRDARNVPGWLVVLSIMYLALWFLSRHMGATSAQSGGVLSAFLSLLPQLIKLCLVLHVIYMALAEHSVDLVDERRRLRRPVAAGAAGLAVLVIVVELWSGGPVPVLLEATGSILMFALALTVNLYVLRSGFDVSLAPALLPAPATRSDRRKSLQSSTATTPADDEAAPSVVSTFVKDRESSLEGFPDEGTVVDAVTRNRFYAQHSLTLLDLAKKLDVPVHRLRRTINQSLGYRNFNQFLNEYRIQEAAIRLTTERHLPILTIALDVGFKSISSFNASFRQHHAMTPSEYRASHDRDAKVRSS